MDYHGILGHKIYAHLSPDRFLKVQDEGRHAVEG